MRAGDLVPRKLMRERTLRGGGPKVLLGEVSRRCYREHNLVARSGPIRRMGASLHQRFRERTNMSTMVATQARTGGMTSDERFVILASSLGTVFEWYDFYLYGSLAGIIGAQFFSAYPPATRDIFALLAFAAGFLVRPFGAIVFGRVGVIVGRKYTFLVTIIIMGLSTFIVGLLLSLLVILFTRTAIGEADFAVWGWRVPFLVSVVLLGISVWIRLRLNESPVFQKMKDEGK